MIKTIIIVALICAALLVCADHELKRDLKFVDKPVIAGCPNGLSLEDYFKPVKFDFVSSKRVYYLENDSIGEKVIQDTFNFNLYGWSGETQTVIHNGQKFDLYTQGVAASPITLDDGKVLTTLVLFTTNNSGTMLGVWFEKNEVHSVRWASINVYSAVRTTYIK